MTDATAVKTELQAIAGLVAASRAILADGRAVDLAGLERRVEALCRSIHGLNRQEADPLKPSLIALIDDIDYLKRDLVAQHDALAIELKRLGAGHRAATAYNRTPVR